MKLLKSEPRQILAERERGTTVLDMAALIAFLRERIDEDVRARRAAGELEDGQVMKMLAANRGIVSGWGHMTVKPNQYTAQAAQVVAHIFRHLLAPYADHPDCRPEWLLDEWGSL